MANLEFSLFGLFQVLLNGAQLTRFESVKEYALLAYLAVEANYHLTVWRWLGCVRVIPNGL